MRARAPGLWLAALRVVALRVVALRVIALWVAALWVVGPAAAQRALDVHFEPTPREVVQAILDIAEVNADDVLYDLGSGDGRIVVAAAGERGARGVGIDLDPQRIAEANANARKAGVTERVRFMQADLFTTDIRAATVVTLYLLPDLNLKLRPRLLAELQPGTRIVSHMHDMGDWKPEKTVKIGRRVVYLWRVPARAQ